MSDERTEALALLRGINTSLLHLLATGPLYVLTPVADAYKSTRRAIHTLTIPGMDQPNMGIRDAGDSTHELKSRNSTAGFMQPPNCSPGVSEPTPPMHAVALEMAEASIASPTLPGEVGN